MEIDDILASVDHSEVSSPESTALDHQLLTRFWVAERSVPEIETIEDLAAASSDTTATLTLSILQTDLSRTQYLLRSLLRQRLSKLTKHSMHYLLVSSATGAAPVPPPASGTSEAKLQQPEDSIPVPDLQSLPDGKKSPLSPSEANFLYTHQTLLARHFGSSFLSSFPPQLRRLDDNAGGTSMVQGPDKREAVFVRCLAEEVVVFAPPGEGFDEEVVGGTMRMGDVWVVRWEGVRRAWERGDVEVL
ncbi:hypothetical protein BDW62DRAFT_196852 [Aspergillus aurantiobrunneus]